MIYTKKRLSLCALLISLNLLFIWGNSLLPSEMSAAFSKLVGAVIDWLIPGPATPAEGEGHGILRKIAHFTEFCSLGMLLSWLVRMTSEKKWQHFAIPLVSGVAAAAIDETIQLFVPGRGPHIRDVGIDSLGVLMGIAILWGIALRKKRMRVK
ncbi:MAG: VanZ family protein [Oscillospiraceae bacterium]|nr:VanZ family protein [Oscillospiraceae bacterium]